MKNYLVLSLVSDIIKGYWIFQAVWEKVCFSFSESSLYGECQSIFEKATTANQIRGTNKHYKLIIIIFFYTIEEILSEFIMDKYYMIFYVNLKPVFCHYMFKSLFLVLLQLCWALWPQTLAAHWACTSEFTSIFVWCSKLHEAVILWITVFSFSSEYWGFLTSFYQWFQWFESEASETPVNGDFTSPVFASALGSKFQFAVGHIKV